MEPVLIPHVREPNSFTLDAYLEAPGLRGPAQGARHEARGDHRRREGVGAARPRRRRLPDRHEVAVRGQEDAEAPLHLLQRGRERARHLQGPPADGAQSAPADRGVRDLLLRHRREGRLHLHPRRVPPRPAHPRSGHRRSLQGGLSREEHPRHRFRLRRLHASRRRRVRGRRRDGAHRVARGQARAAAHQAAVPGRRRPLRLSDRGEQRRDALQRPADHLARRRVVHLARPREERRPEAVLRQRPRRQARRVRRRR